MQYYLKKDSDLGNFYNKLTIQKEKKSYNNAQAFGKHKYYIINIFISYLLQNVLRKGLGIGVPTSRCHSHTVLDRDTLEWPAEMAR